MLDIEAPALADGLRIRIINAAGMLVWSGIIFHHTRLNVTEWARGLYLTSVINQDGLQLQQRFMLK